MEANDNLKNYDDLSVQEKILLELDSKLEVNIDQDLAEQLEDQDLAEQFKDKDLTEQFKDEDLAEQFKDEDLAEQLEDDDTVFNLDELSITDKIKCEEMIMSEVNKRISQKLEYELEKLKKKNSREEKKNLNKLVKLNKNILKKEKELEEELEEAKFMKEQLYKKLLSTDELKVQLDIKAVDITSKLKTIDQIEKKLEEKEESFKNQINNELKKLEAEKEKFNKLKKILESDEDNKFIKINVGGKIFSTTTNTLKDYSPYFQGLLSGNFSEGIKDDQGNIFIDRSPEQFDKILKLMRNPLQVSEFKITEELEVDMDYYLIDFEKSEVYDNQSDNESDDESIE